MFLPFVLAILALPALRADTICPNGFTDTNGYCWRIFGNVQTHDQAETICNENRGAKLATVNNPALNSILAANGSSFETLWLGYKCTSKTHCTGNDGSAINTTNFYSGQANPSVGQCVVMDTSGPMAGKWMSLNCNQISAFICGLNLVNTDVPRMMTSKCGVPYQLNVPVNISSMNYPGNYDNDENCAYFIYGGPFTIYFDDFYTQPTFDVVSIYSSTGNYGPLTFVGQYSGHSGPFKVPISSAAALITFVTDDMFTYLGFSARIVKS